MPRALGLWVLWLCACGGSAEPEEFIDAAQRADARASADALVPPVADAAPMVTYQIVLGETYSLPAHGGGGGGPFSLACPDGSLAAGIAGRSGTEVDQIALSCKPLAEDGTLGAITQTDRAGGNGGDPFDDTCPDGEALVGLAGRSGTRVDRIQGFCAALEPWIDIAMGSGVLPARGGGGGEPFDDTCPHGTFLFALDGRSGNRVDQVQGRCVRVVK